MDLCPSCKRSIPLSASTCPHCALQAEFAAEPGSLAAESATRSGFGMRQVMMIVVALFGSAMITLSMLNARGDVAATAAPPAAAAAVPVPAAAAAPVMAAPAPAAMVWAANNAQWTAGARKAVAFELHSENETQIWTRKVRPRLVVRCMGTTPEVFVFTESAADMEAQDDNHTIRVSLDGEPDRTERWPDSDSHDALFVPDGPAFLRQLSGARTMRFGYTPHNATPVVANFAVAGLAAKLAPVASRCGLPTLNRD